MVLRLIILNVRTIIYVIILSLVFGLADFSTSFMLYNVVAFPPSVNVTLMVCCPIFNESKYSLFKLIIVLPSFDVYLDESISSPST